MMIAPNSRLPLPAMMESTHLTVNLTQTPSASRSSKQEVGQDLLNNWITSPEVHSFSLGCCPTLPRSKAGQFVARNWGKNAAVTWSVLGYWSREVWWSLSREFWTIAIWILRTLRASVMCTSLHIHVPFGKKRRVAYQTRFYTGFQLKI